MAEGRMFSFRRFRIREYATYYKKENPGKCLLFDFNNEGTQAPEDTQALEVIQAPEDTHAPEDTEPPETSEEKRERKGKAVVEYNTAIGLETSVEYVIISDSETATDSEPEDPKGNETGVDIHKAYEVERKRKGKAPVEYENPTVIGLENSVEYEIISDSETATDSEPEAPKENETGVETDKEIVEPMDLDYDTSRTISDGPMGMVKLSHCPNEDSDDESDDIYPSSLRKRRANQVSLDKKKRKALKAKKPRFDEASHELDGSHAELLDHLDKALNLDDEEMSGAKRKGSRSRSRPGCCKPSGSGSVMDRTGGAKKQRALKAKVPRRLVMTKQLSRILEGLKSEFATKKLAKTPILSEGESAAAKHRGSGSCAGSVVGQAHGAEIQKVLEGKAPQLDVAGPSSRGPKDDHIPTEKLVRPLPLSDGIVAAKCKGSGVCGGVDGCEPSGSGTVVAQACGTNGASLELVQVKPLDHEVLNCTLNMNPSEFCTESARNFRRMI